MTTRTSKRPGTRRSVTAAEERAPAIAFEVAVVESNQAHQKRVRELATELGYPVALEVGAESVMDRVRADPPGAILVGLPDHEMVVVDCLALEPDRPVVIASLAAPAATARARAAAASADLFTVRPHSRDTLSAALAAAEKLAALRERLRALKPGKPVSFARLMRDAQSALKAAQLRGGAQVVVRK
jgi:CheY-like chemotaxis protein